MHYSVVLIDLHPNDLAAGGEGADTYIFGDMDGSDYFQGGQGGGWTDVIQLDAANNIANDPDNPWTISVNGAEVEFDLADGALALAPDTNGVVTMADGSELTFEGVEQIEW